MTYKMLLIAGIITAALIFATVIMAACHNKTGQKWVGKLMGLFLGLTVISILACAGILVYLVIK